MRSKTLERVDTVSQAKGAVCPVIFTHLSNLPLT